MLLADTASQLMAARYQMALSLGFHIVLSCVGVAFPAMIFAAHWRGMHRGDAAALTLARKWSKVAAVLFAVGAVSGTILSFEMGLLWPGLMSQFGDVIGLPFAMEGIAFFTEAIFLGIYLYGWDRLSPRVHLLTLVPIMVSGLFGTFCILAVNAWMNSPSGFDLVDGKVTNVNPLAAMFNDAVWTHALHMFLAAYIVTGFLVASVYAVGMRRGRTDRTHRLGFTIAFAFASVAALVQPFVGHVTGMRLATAQPSKLAAMELAVTTETHAPLTIGGIYVNGRVVGAIQVPGLGSFIARGSTDLPIKGFDQIPAELLPPINVTHLAFQTMVGLSLGLAGLVLWFWWRRRRGHDPLASRRFLRAASWSGAAAVVALQAGWTTTEVGRQPWIAFGILKVDEAVTHNSGVWISLTVLAIVYTAMGVAAVRVMQSMSRRWRAGETLDLPSPYGPAAADVDRGAASNELANTIASSERS